MQNSSRGTQMLVKVFRWNDTASSVFVPTCELVPSQLCTDLADNKIQGNTAMCRLSGQGDSGIYLQLCTDSADNDIKIDSAT